MGMTHHRNATCRARPQRFPTIPSASNRSQRGLFVEAMESRLLLADVTLALPANIEGNLTSLYLAAQFEGTSRLSQTSVLPFQIDALGRPMVSIWVRGDLATVVADLGRMDADVHATSPEYRLIEASVQIGDIPGIAAMPHVLAVTPVYRV